MRCGATGVEVRATVMLVNAWAASCDWCREELDELESLQCAHAPKGLRVGTAGEDEQEMAPCVERFAKSHEVT